MTYAIDIKNLRKEFGSKVAVKDINLQVRENIIFALLGVNGAGKTTTIRMLTGLSKPTAGEAFVLGKSISTELDEVKKISDISPQETSVAPNLTVKENLEFMAQIYGMDEVTAESKVNSLMEKFALTEVANSKAKVLSGGWQRRLSIAMALISEPQILFLDEPTLGLDVLARQELWNILRELKGSMTIILTTHYMEEAEELSDDVAVMVDGEIRARGTAAELRELTGQASLEKAFIQIASSNTAMPK